MPYDLARIKGHYPLTQRQTLVMPVDTILPTAMSVYDFAVHGMM
jgi:hypothetical protein